MKKVRILYVYGGILHRGGIEAHMMSIFRNIDKAIFQIDFVVHGFEEGVFDKEISENGSTIFHVPVKSNDLRGNLAGLHKIFVENDYEIVHAHMDAMSSVVLKIAKECGVKIRISHSHNTKHLTTNPFKYLINELARLTIPRYATHMFACSDLAGKWLFGKKNVKTDKVYIVRNAIDFKKFEFDQSIRESMRKRMKIENRYVIGHIGRFEDQKNHKYLLNVFKRVIEIDNNALLIMVGDGSNRMVIHDFVKQNNLQDNVMLLGSINNVNQILNIFDVFVLPSKFEGLGIVLIEAQVNGLKCYASSNIPREVAISNRVKFLPIIEASIELWANEVLKSEKRVPLLSVDIMTSGYDIVSETKHVEKLYLGFVKELNENSIHN